MAASKCIQKYRKGKRKSRKRRGSVHGFDEAKYLIFDMLTKARKLRTYLTPRDIAKECRITLASVTELLRRYHRMGYIYRRREFREGKRNNFCYKHLKPKGHRTYGEMAKRVSIREVSGVFVSLNRKKLVPPEAKSIYEKDRKLGGGVINDPSMTSALTPPETRVESDWRDGISHGEEHEEERRRVS